LLWAGIGDTIRVSLSAEPEEEVRVGYEILKASASAAAAFGSCPARAARARGST
jgi:(E)-4-hydroxy-3-methylbut-2-enyl-diphosphate synthase